MEITKDSLGATVQQEGKEELLFIKTGLRRGSRLRPVSGSLMRKRFPIDQEEASDEAPSSRGEGSLESRGWSKNRDLGE